MSAERLREAAALMRERAAAATPGPWGSTWDNQVVAAFGSASDGEQLADAYESASNADHMACADPVVMLAVADLLDAIAAEHEVDTDNERVASFFNDFDTASDVVAVALADVYLGGAA